MDEYATDRTDPSNPKPLRSSSTCTIPPEKVWRALTDPALLGSGCSLHRLRAGAGRGDHVQAPPQPGWDGTVSRRFLEIEAQRKLSWSWVVGDITRWRVDPRTDGDGQRLTLVQSGFEPDQRRNFAAALRLAMMGGSWSTCSGGPHELPAHAADSHDVIRVQGARVNNLKERRRRDPEAAATVFTVSRGRASRRWCSHTRGESQRPSTKRTARSCRVHADAGTAGRGRRWRG